MKGKIVSLFAIAWGGTILAALAIYWDPFGDKLMQGLLALLTGGTLVWSGLRGLMPIKPVDPLSSDYGFEPPQMVRKYNALRESPHRKLPGWAAPPAGIALGVLIGIRLAFADQIAGKVGDLGLTESFLLATGIGFLGGCAVWCLDAFRKRAERRAIDALRH